MKLYTYRDGEKASQWEEKVWGEDQGFVLDISLRCLLDIQMEIGKVRFVSLDSRKNVQLTV